MSCNFVPVAHVTAVRVSYATWCFKSIIKCVLSVYSLLHSLDADVESGGTAVI